MMNATVGDFDIQGHRGARGLFPENTLRGFAAAIAIGVDTLELDVAVTADDVVVVTHDPHLNPDVTRNRAGSWLSGPTPLIRELTFAELADYDVGRIRPDSAYATAFPDQHPHDGARIPSLAEVLALDPLVFFNIELKTFPDRPDLTVSPERMADLVIATADAQGVTSRIIIQSLDWRGPRHVRQHDPRIALAWLTQVQSAEERRLWWDGVSLATYGGSVPRAVAAEADRRANAACWIPQWAELDATLIDEAHALGLRIVPWDVDQAADMKRAIAWGVDGLITDRPDLARRLRRELMGRLS
jgi:glycerophosphoryl diester phosphodiesterase